MTKLAKPQLVGVTWKDMYDKYDRMSKVSEKAQEFFDLIAESKKKFLKVYKTRALK